MALLAGGASMQAKTADELRIYINPGHGSFTADDRPCQIIGRNAYSATNTDSAGFYESNTDLIKGFGVLEKLIQYGVKFDRTLNQTGERWQIGAARDLSNNIVMSRVKNGPYFDNNLTTNQINAEIKKIKGDRELADCTEEEKAQIAKWEEQKIHTVHYNRNLSEICEEVEANNFDMFISIHSNATGEGSTTNYALFLYRGYDAHSTEFEQTCYNMAKACWPYAIANEHMTWSAYSATKMNLRGDIDYYGKSSTGSLGYKGNLGVLKHGTPGFLVEGYFHTYQPARHRAMNDDVNIMEGYEYARGIADYFNLKKESTGDIYGIVRDLHEKFTHKLYTPAPTSDDIYLPLNGVTVTLKKDGKEVDKRVTDNWYNGAYVFKDIEPGKYTLEFAHHDYKEIDPVEVEVKAASTAYPVAKMENVGYEPPKIVYVTYPDEFNIPAMGPQSTYNFNKVYGDQAIEVLAGKTIKRAIAAGDLVYILALDENQAPTVVVYNTDKKEVVRTLSTEGTAGDIRVLSDIALTADGVLVGINKAKGSFNGAANVNVYKWTNNEEDNIAEGAPAKWFSANNVGNWSNGITGESMAFAGTSTDGTLLYTAVTSAASGNLRIVKVAIANGVNAGAYHMNHNSNENGNEPAMGNYQLNISPADDNNFILTGEKTGAAEYVCAPAAAGVPTPVSTMGNVADKAAYRVQMFKYAGASYMAVASTAEGKNVGVTLVDITNGLKNAKAIKTVNTDIDPSELPGVVAMGQTLVTRDLENNVTDGWMNLYVARAEGMSRFTTKSVEQPVSRAAFAYDLTQEGDSKTGYTLSFKSIADAPEAEIVLTDADGNETVIPAGEVKSGDNSVTVTPEQLTEKATYNWAVRVKSEPNGVAGRVFTAAARGKDSRGGVVFINDTESDNFGKIVVSNGNALGIDLYDAALNHLGNYFKGDSRFNAGNAASTFRAGQRDGIAYIVDWSDKGAGYWMFDPSDPTKLENFLEGTKNSAGGHVVDGKVIGGGATDVAFVGKGDDCKMITYVEDITPANSLVRYDIGSAKTWGKAPDKFYTSASGRLANTNVALAATDNGVFAAQVRTAGNNAKGTPSFIYIDLEGNELFNSSVLTDLNSGGAGIAINNDRTLLAVAEHQTGISVWNVTWDGNTPSMTKLYTIPGSAVSGGNGETNDIEFDNANNIYAYHRATRGFTVYALRDDAPEAVTPAKSSFVIEGPTSGVEDVVVDGDDSDAPVEFYNLQGIRVNADNLTPGIYVRRQGKTSTKVIIK